MDSQDNPGAENPDETIPLFDPQYDYYSIDNIMEEEVLLKVKPLSKILDAGCLRESDYDGTISTDTEIELPAWIAIPLVRNHCAELLEPIPFKHHILYVV